MITVLGASGFVGSNLVKIIREKGLEHYAPERSENLVGKNLGHVIYCIGMTADFRSKPFETVEAHVSKLAHVLQNCQFESLIYLSSTRVYLKSNSQDRYLTEEDDIKMNSNDGTDLFAASKITGELLALNCGKDNIKIVRLSNVFGADLLSENFITSIVKDALNKNAVELFTTQDSSKDYISIEDVCISLLKLVDYPHAGIFNLAYGQNTSNAEILSEMNKITGATVSYSPNAKRIVFQEISNKKLSSAINFSPTKSIISSLSEIISAFKR